MNTIGDDDGGEGEPFGVFVECSASIIIRLLMLRARVLHLPEHAARSVNACYGEYVEAMTALPPEQRRIEHHHLDTMERLITSWEAPNLVHILRGGVTLCDAWPGKTPAEWPQGERWTPIEEPKPCTCPGCRVAFVRARTAS